MDAHYILSEKTIDFDLPYQVKLTTNVIITFFFLKIQKSLLYVTANIHKSLFHETLN